MAKRLSLGRLERLAEELNRNIDLEGSDVTVNTLTSDGKITTNDGGLAVIGDNLTVKNADVVFMSGSVTVQTGPRVTQLTSKSTAVAGPGLVGWSAGTITTHAAALAAGATVSFTVGTDEDNAPALLPFEQGGSIVLASISRTTTDRAFGGDYTVTTSALDGDAAINAYMSFQINITNNSAGSLSEALVINYIIMHAEISTGPGMS
jgi:hypothetical protein